MYGFIYLVGILINFGAIVGTVMTGSGNCGLDIDCITSNKFLWVGIVGTVLCTFALYKRLRDR